MYVLTHSHVLLCGLNKPWFYTNGYIVFVKDVSLLAFKFNTIWQSYTDIQNVASFPNKTTDYCYDNKCADTKLCPTCSTRSILLLQKPYSIQSLAIFLFIPVVYMCIDLSWIYGTHILVSASRELLLGRISLAGLPFLKVRLYFAYGENWT